MNIIVEGRRHVHIIMEWVSESEYIHSTTNQPHKKKQKVIMNS